MSLGITARRCDACQHVHFPARPVCPRCHGADFAQLISTHATVEQLTTLVDSGIHLATLRTDIGPVVVGRVAGDVQVGRTLELSRSWGVPGTAFVPTDGGEVRPTRPNPLRGLPIELCTVPDLLVHQAELYRDKPLVRCGDTTWSYRDTKERAARSAAALNDRGIRPGDRVALWCSNRLELLETLLGCAWLGAIAVPLNTALRGAGLRRTLADSGARALLIESDLLPILADIDLPTSLTELWVLDAIDADSPPRGAGEIANEVAAWPDVQVLAYPRTDQRADAADAGPGETLAILYTSGTTGLPKGVCCPHAQFYWWGVNVSECLEIDDEDVVFTCLPLFHTNALNAFFQVLVSGATYVLGRRFSASRFWSQVAACDATVTYLLGAMVQILRSRPDSESDRDHRVRVALSPATPAAAHDDFETRFGVALVEGYGSTETNMVIGATPQHQRPGLMGVTLADFETRVADQRGADVPDGVPGELLCRSHQPFAFATGYFDNTVATADAWRDMWFHTGDRVIRHPGGWLQFVDRINDSIRRRGENISSLEVEQVLGAHPAVESVAAYAVPSELSEDEVMAAVILIPTMAAEPAELADWCGPRLPYFAVPRYIDVLPALPLTENGKVRKAVLRERGVTATTWDSAAIDSA